MKVLHVAAEIFPLVKTGGLADVVGALPQALIEQGADVRLLLPGLPAIIKGVESLLPVCDIGPIFGAGQVTLRVGNMVNSGVIAYVIDAPYLYRRSGSPYQAPDGSEWSDNVQRFALLGWVAAHMAAGEFDPDWSPDVLHAHDWHAAMACAYVSCRPASSAATIFTVHNLAYQGVFSDEDFHLLHLPSRLMVPGGLEYHGQFSFMKAGLKFAHRVTTVSPSYAREIATSEFGCGLDGVIRSRGASVSGILNGVDGVVWNPATDQFLAQTYSSDALEGKAACKAALQQEMDLRVDPNAPLLAMVSRLTSQKGLDILLGAMTAVAEDPRAQDAQLVVQGTGDPSLEAAFRAVARGYHGRVAVHLSYSEALAHRVIAGADALVVPSRFEPCGLTQLYALRYGTVPIVRRVGGLADTVVDLNNETREADTATGFVFGPPTSSALTQAFMHAVSTYRDHAAWRRLIARGMAQNFSWGAAARQYMALYEEVMREYGTH